ncbi:MAG: hypothetical protein H7840_15570 [Alphaproteobacteria bacterium]
MRIKEAMEIFRPLAERGDPLAQYQLGFIYWAFMEDEPIDTAIALYRKAAESGQARAMQGLAFLLLRPDVDDPEAAIPWIRAAADRLDYNARIMLEAMEHFDGEVPRSRDEAEGWLESVASEGDQQAAWRLCRIATGPYLGVRDLFSWCLDLAEEGHAEAQVRVAMVVHARGDDPTAVFQDEWREHFELDSGPAAALPWYRKAAKAGHPLAQARMALLLARSGDDHLDEAVQWAKASAEQNNDEGMAYLGLFLLRGRGVPRDETRGAELVLKAADLDNTLAACTAAYLYLHGIGVPRDALEAGKWIYLVNSRGRPDGDVLANVKDIQPFEDCHETAANVREFQTWELRLAAQRLALETRERQLRAGQWPHPARR